jgi:hypothetical protein
MKKPITLLLLLVLGMLAQGQLKVTATCPAFEVDILDGKVNGLRADARLDDIKTKFPCFSSVDPEEGSSKCGGAVNFKARDLYFFTQRNYVEIREKFAGKLSLPLMGAARGGLFKWLGNPKLKDVSWDAFEMSYGILVLHYNKAGKVNLIQFSTRGTETLSLCE